MNIQVTITSGATITIELEERTISRNDNGDEKEIKGESYDDVVGEDIFVKATTGRNEQHVSVDSIEKSNNITTSEADIAQRINNQINLLAD